MPLTKQERDLIRLEAKDIAFAVCKEVMVEHTKICPHGKAIYASKWFALGIFATSGMLGGGGIVALLKILPGM